MGVESRYGLKFGYMDHGPRNLITDVPGVRVGQVTLHDGEVHTGVTAIIPHTGDVFHEKCLAGAHVINGFGKSIGLVQVQELGTLETPILLTNTLSVGTVSTALVEYMLERNDDIGLDAGTVNSLVMECNDARLSDIRGLHITKEHARAALDAAADTFAQLLSAAANEVEEPVKRRVLAQMLYHLGRWIYLIDGADDLKKDAESGNYNPVALRYGLTDGTWTPESRRDFATTLDHSIHQMAAAFELWDFGVWTPVLQSTFYGGLFQVGKAVLDGSFHRPSRKNIREIEETE